MPSNMTLFTLHCPKCGKEEMVARPIIFDAASHPEEAGQIKEDTYFTAKCPACGETQDFLMNMLYVDTAHLFMVALQPDPKLPIPAIHNQTVLRSSVLRVVRDSEDLADKVRELESGIDDRLIELAKYELYLKIRPTLPAGSLLGMPVFHVSEDGPKISLPMDIKGKGLAMGTDRLTENRVAQLKEKYEKALSADSAQGFRVVDREWAMQLGVRSEE